MLFFISYLILTTKFNVRTDLIENRTHSPSFAKQKGHIIGYLRSKWTRRSLVRFSSGSPKKEHLFRCSFFISYLIFTTKFNVRTDSAENRTHSPSFCVAKRDKSPVRNPQKLVATASRRDGVYNRTGKPSVIFAEKEELYSERETAKGCCERYEANDDVVGRWLAAAVRLSLIYDDLRQIWYKNIRTTVGTGLAPARSKFDM